MLKMESGVDFVNTLEYDMSLKILMCLEDPSDIVRASSVSRSWRHFGELISVCVLIYGLDNFTGNSNYVFVYWPMVKGSRT